MNAFQAASQFGYSQDDILDFLSKQIPNLGGMIQKAVAAGYTTDQVIGYLSKIMGGGSVPKKVENNLLNIRKRGPVTAADLTSQVRNAPAPERDGTEIFPALGALAGGAVGLATGVGAIPAIIGGITGGSELLRRYETQAAQGGDLSLNDFLMSMAKGAGGGALAKTATTLLNSLSGKLGMGAKAAATPTQSGSQPQNMAATQQTKPPEGTQQAVSPQVPVVEIPAVDALSILKSSKLANTLETTLNLPVADAAGVMKTILGPKASKALEAKTGLPFEKLVEIGRTQLETPKESKRQPIVQLDEFVSKIPTLDVSNAPRRKLQAKQIAAIPSSNLRSIEYDPKTKDLITLFSPSGPKSVGELYLHPGVEPDEVEDILKGATTITRGENRIRAWALGKEGSFGAGFDRFKKKFHENRESVAIDPSYIPGSHLLDVRKADQIFMAAQSFEPFEELTLKAKARQSKQDFANQEEMFRALDDSTFEAIYAEVVKGMKKEKQASKDQGKTVRYKGGAPKEMLTRMKKKALERG